MERVIRLLDAVAVGSKVMYRKDILFMFVVISLLIWHGHVGGKLGLDLPFSRHDRYFKVSKEADNPSQG
jgi:hypothetical protein